MKVTEVRTKETKIVEGYELEIRGEIYNITLDIGSVSHEPGEVFFNKGGFPINPLFASEYEATVICPPAEPLPTPEHERFAKPVQVPRYPVNTYISSDPGILFNDNKQLLFYQKCNKSWAVRVNGNKFKIESEKYDWVPTKREYLQPGDIAYRTNKPGDREPFDRLGAACIVLDPKRVACVNPLMGVHLSERTFKFWFKLVPSFLELTEDKKRPSETPLAELIENPCKLPVAPALFPVHTPISEGGGIIFSEGRKILYYSQETKSWATYNHAIPYKSKSHLYVWTPIERENLKAGDVAYKSNVKQAKEDFKRPNSVCIILNKDRYVSADRYGGIVVAEHPHPYWYKLVPQLAGRPNIAGIDMTSA